MLEPVAGMRILDVGTGIVAEQIRIVAGPRAVVVGIDAALTMLNEGRQAFEYPVAVARLPELPFVAGIFDLAAAAFVISHVPDYEGALQEIARACRAHARVGVTAWGSLPNLAAQPWTEMAARFVPRVELDRAFRAQIPWDEWFSDRTRLLQALEAAGLQQGIVETRTYRIRMSTSDFLVSRDASLQGAMLRERLSHDQWGAFTRQVSDAFETRFGGFVEYDRDVHFGVAQRP